MAGRSSPANSGRVSSQIADKIRLEILSLKIAGGAFLPSVRSLAAEHGVAKKTVERALKRLEADGLIASVPRHGFRVLKPTAESDRGLPVAYVAHSPGSPEEFWDEFHKQLVASFQQVAAQRGWSLLVVSHRPGRVAEALEQMKSAGVCGAIIDMMDDELIEALGAAGIPTVSVDGWVRKRDIDMVNQDGFLGGFVAAEHLLSKEHRRIGFLGARPLRGDVQILERYGGAAAALAREGRYFSPELCARAPLGDREGTVRAARGLLDQAERPTAVLSLWQDMTAGLIVAARELRLRIGVDFDIVGWSTEEAYGTFVAQFLGAPVAPAIVWSVARMAKEAVRCLKSRRAEPGSATVHVRVPTRLKIFKPR